MEICGIQCIKEPSSKELIRVNSIPKSPNGVDYISTNPNIELFPNYKSCPAGYAIKIIVQTEIKNINYASVAYYISEMEIPKHIEKEFYTQLVTYSVNNHIENIYKETSERKPLSFYNSLINFIVSL